MIYPVLLSDPDTQHGESAMAKRLCDVIFAVSALIAFFPFFVVVAILIKADSSGPVMFRQTRIGIHRTRFTILKFRTMVSGSGNPAEQVREGDPRVTRIGQILRFTRIDELPQFVNVLRGEMSLVGPRPHTEAFADYLAERIPAYSDRFRVKPGLAGLGQLRREEQMRKRNRELPFGAIAHHDRTYITHQSLCLDCYIFFATLHAVGRKIGEHLATRML